MSNEFEQVQCPGLHHSESQALCCNLTSDRDSACCASLIRNACDDKKTKFCTALRQVHRRCSQWKDAYACCHQQHQCTLRSEAQKNTLDMPIISLCQVGRCVSTCRHAGLHHQWCSSRNRLILLSQQQIRFVRLYTILYFGFFSSYKRTEVGGAQAYTRKPSSSSSV
ncbi:hypothetical protein DUNSADRAFT_18031 [Dunaliella salina]|uniref:GDNF/GAS1 domain-containing protein n=1 Tax=Dunaliella salina TaxID=3046 RepID=A0ABQ7G0T0_DUNSA|nr:hypothetical protein DUNSADRAFT_18031 [Dunaliella salina]|eukprot:KAF5828206.1 hypothetical protein DUNSADRAFT_18031 [Dunaliella salina]